MAREIMKKQDLLWLFNNGDKPSAQDFEALINFADSDTIWIRHEVNGTGKRSIEVDVNEFLTFTRRYNEVHLLAHITGTYIFKNLGLETYGNGAKPTNRTDFIHISPHPNIINDNAPNSEYSTLSAKYIHDNFDDQTELENNYVSRTRDTKIIDEEVDIQSYGDIKAHNVINEIKYDEGVLKMYKGADDKAYINKFHLAPDSKIVLINVPATDGAPDIAAHFNDLSSSTRSFIKGDTVFLKYDLSDVEDRETKENSYGVRHYIIKKEFEFEAEPFVITNVAEDLISLSTITLHSIMSRVYTKEDVDSMLTAASQGITGSYEDYASVPVADADISVEGNSVIVESYNGETSIGAGDGNGGAIEDGERGVFRFDESWPIEGQEWRFMYTQKYDHTHRNGDLIDLKHWVKGEQSAVFLSGFIADDESLHFTKVFEDKINANESETIDNAADIASNLGHINTLFDTTNAHGGRLNVNEAAIINLGLIKAPMVHTHHDLYYTKSQCDGRYLGINAKAKDSDKLDGKDSTYFAKNAHSHNDLYYTESESNSKFLGKTAKAKDSDKLDNRDSTSFANASHTHPISQVTGLQAELDDKMNSSEMESLLPRGAIVLWATTNPLPAGWQMCNGENGAPLLDQVFIRGTSDINKINANTVKGSDDSVAISHNHTGSVTINSTPAHTHLVNAKVGVMGTGDNSGGGGESGRRTMDAQYVKKATVSGGAHAHTIKDFKVNSNGASGKDKNMPAYVTLGYIMKMF